MQRNNVAKNTGKRRRRGAVENNVSKREEVAVSSSTNGKHAARYNFLTCLACAQKCGIDFTGMAWIGIQGDLGQGGQAVVSQTLMNVETVLAFKRRNSQGIGSTFSQGVILEKRMLEDHFRQIASEILAFGHPVIRQNPNIVQLHAIGWELQDEDSWAQGRKMRVWPVLIFEKAIHGDLKHYISTQKNIDLAEKVRLCRNIASALIVAHENGIIHGDIKPENVLVFGTKEIVAKLGDFGFSGFASDNKIQLAKTEPWAAPETDLYQTHTIENAKQTDVYSFGVLCLWTIFKEQLMALESSETLEATKVIRVYKSQKILQQEALKLSGQILDPVWRSRLQRLFEVTLAYNPSDRIFKSSSAPIFEDIAQLLDWQSSVELPHSVIIPTIKSDRDSITIEYPDPSTFKVSESLQQLCLTNFRIRQHIFNCLKREYRETTTDKKSNLAVQLAFCKRLGFGTEIGDHTIVQKYLKEAQDLQQFTSRQSDIEIFDEEHLDVIIRKTHMVQQHSSTLLRKLYEDGTMQALFQGQESRKTESEVLNLIENHRKEEIKAMEKSLGPIHPAVLNLKWSLCRFLMERKEIDILAPVECLHEIVNSLEAEDAMGPDHRDTIVAKAYRAYLLLGIRQPQIKDMIHAEAQAVVRDLERLEFNQHAAACMLYAALVDILISYGHFDRSRDMLARAKKIVEPKFGPDHPYYTMVTDLENRLHEKSQNDDDVIKENQEMLARMTGVLEDPMVSIILRRKLVAAYLRKGDFISAIEMIEENEQLLREHKKVQKEDPMILCSAIYAAMSCKRHKHAVKTLKILINNMKTESWPPPTSRRCDQFYIDIRDSMALVELMGKHNIEIPLRPHPDPNRFTVDPELMVMVGNLIVSMDADTHTEPSSMSTSNEESESKTHMNWILENINSSFGLGPPVQMRPEWTGPTKTKGIAGSVIRAVMDKEYAPLVEILTYLGYLNFHGGLHYDIAIAATKAGNYDLLTAILEEHRELCSEMDGPRGEESPIFQSRDDMAAWVTGQWKGGFIHRQLSNRMDPEGNLTMDLGVSYLEDRQHTIKITGTCLHGTEDMIEGEYTIDGNVDLSGSIYLHLIGKKESSQSQKLAGRINLEREAFGGFCDDDRYEGYREFSKDESQGTFFLYKC